MRVLLITGSLPPMKCGVGDYTAHLARALGKRGDASVAILTDIAAGNAATDPYVHVFPVVRGWKVSDAKTVLKTIRRWTPDIVHIQYPTQGYNERLFPYFLPIIVKLLGIPVVQTWHEYYRKGSLIVFLNAVASNSIVVVRPNYRNVMAPIYRFLIPYREFRHIQNASTIPIYKLDDAERYDVHSRYTDASKKLIVYFGFAFYKKGVDLLFDIADPALHHLVLICDLDRTDEYHEQIFDRMEQTKWAEHVTVTGYLPGEDAARLLAAADAVVFPFRNGGGIWNTSIHGAVTQGSFVLATSTERNGYDSSDNIYYARPGDVAEMREALREYAGRRNPPTTRVADWSSISATHIQLYRSLLGRGTTD